RHLQLCSGPPFHGSGNLFSDSLAHAGHHETSVTDADPRVLPLDLYFSGDYSFLKSGFLLKMCDFFFVAFVVEWVTGTKTFVPFLEGSFVSYHLDPAVGMNPEIPSAFWTDIISLFYVLGNDGATAFVTFPKKPFRHLRPSVVQRNIRFSGRG